MISPNILKLLQNIVLKTNSFPFLRKIYFLIYVFAVRYATANLRWVKGVKAVYLGTEIDERTYVFGSSDIDLAIVIDGNSPTLKKVLQKIARIRRFFPMVGAPAIFTETQFKNFYSLNPIRIIRRQRKPLLGKDILKECAILKDRDFVMRSFFGQYFSEFFDLGKTLFLKERRLHYQRMSLNIFAKMIQYACYARGLLELDKPYTKRQILRIALANTGAEFIPYEVRQYMEKKQYYNFSDAGRGERYARIYSNAIFYLDKISGEWHKKNKPPETEVSSFRITTESYIQETQENALLETKNFLNTFPKEFVEYFASIILTSVPNANYSNRIYMILKEKTTERDLSGFINWLYQNFKQHFKDEKTYLKPVFPFIMAENSFRLGAYDGTSIYIRHPLEYFSLARHAKIVYGRDFKGLIERPRDDVLCKNMLAYTSTLLAYLRGTIHHFYRSFDGKGVVDFVCGALPSIKLFFEKRIITTTPKETLKEYKRCYEGAGPLNEFYGQYNGLSSDEMIRQKEDIVKKGCQLMKEQMKEIEEILDAAAVNYF